MNPTPALVLLYVGGVLTSFAWLTVLVLLAQTANMKLSSGRLSAVLWTLFATVLWPLFIPFTMAYIALGGGGGQPGDGWKYG